MAEIEMDHEVLAKKIAAFRSQGRKVVLVDGCFDLLHVWHVRFLREAKGLGDVLVLALRSDESIKRIVSPYRPLLPLEDRSKILSAFEMVDIVTSFDEDTVDGLLGQVKPDIYAKKPSSKTKGDLFAGKVVLVKNVFDHTNQIIKEILRKYSDPSIKINE